VKINEKVNKMIQALMKNHPNTKLSVGFYNKGETSFKLFDATGEIPYESHAYEIASISKVFTTSLLAKYVQEGKMHLNDSVAKYIPELETDKYFPTLKRLATHTAGYKHEALTSGELVKVLFKFWWQNFRKKPSGYFDAFGVVDYEKLIWFAKKIKLEDKDYEWGYTDYSIALLGEAVCQRAGKPYDELMTTFLTNDLGLKNTKTVTNRPDMLDGYLYNYNVGTMKLYRKGDYAAPAGCLTSTAEDLLKFAEMNIEESPSFLSLCHNEYPVNQENYDMGLGWWIFNKQEQPTHWHGGGSEGFASSLFFCKEHKYAAVVLTNAGDYAEITPLSNAVASAQFDECL